MKNTLKSELMQALSGLEADIGCEVRIHYDLFLSNEIGRILYNEDGAITVLINAAGLVLFKLKNLHWQRLSDKYPAELIRMHLQLDVNALRNDPGSYIEGLAVISHILKRERDNKIRIFPADLCRQDRYFHCPGRQWLQDDLFCDLRAKENISEPAGLIKGAADLLSLPEIVYLKNKLPQFGLLYLLQKIDEAVKDRTLDYSRWPVLRSLYDEMEILKEDAGHINRLLSSADPLKRGIAVRLPALNGFASFFEAGTGEIDPDIYAAEAGRYQRMAAAYIKNCSNTGNYTLLDNRIAIEYIARKIDAILLEEHINTEEGSVHPLGYSL